MLNNCPWDCFLQSRLLVNMSQETAGINVEEILRDEPRKKINENPEIMI
jgi:hypothetical protein